jgi:hypothetical protein
MDHGGAWAALLVGKGHTRDILLLLAAEAVMGEGGGCWQGTSQSLFCSSRSSRQPRRLQLQLQAV